MTMPMVHRDMEPYEKFIYILDDTIQELDAIVKKETAKRQNIKRRKIIFTDTAGVVRQALLYIY